ncbi:hypothetical protein DFH09DRAFT_1080187 [Mycena vulgaris]|nr:hypothetical protein DFH09DRAFT_1080187 [Mycena vulgaris]
MEAKINNGNEERPVSVYRIQGIQCAVCFVVVEGRALQGAGWIDVLRYFKAITRRQAVLSILEAHSFGYIKRRVRVILVSQFSIEAAELAVFRISLFSFGSIFNLSWDNGIHPPFGIESESAPPAHSSNSTHYHRALPVWNSYARISIRALCTPVLGARKETGLPRVSQSSPDRDFRAAYPLTQSRFRVI